MRQASFVVHSLILSSIMNAIFTFWRKKHYRLFESNIDAVPSTPSARRVRVDSSPFASSPLVFLSNLMGTDSARSRAHPDPQRDVWEVAVWDPVPVCLRLSCYFSPGHVLVYCMFLPVANTDPRPSTTIALAISIGVLLSLQMSLLQTFFSQQAKDSAVISKEVMNEYDTKYVRPRTHPLYRDVGTQFSELASYTATKEDRYNVVETHTPRIVVNKGFRPNPNPNYMLHTDPDAAGLTPGPSRYPPATPSYAPPAQALRTPASFQDQSSPMRPATAIRQPVFRPPTAGGDGGSLGVYAHAASPLRKSASTSFDSRGQSPIKRPSLPPGGRLNQLKSDRSRRESGRL